MRFNSHHSDSLEQLDCGCFRYCDHCTDSRPRTDDIVEFSRDLADFLGEGWSDWDRWEATELTATELNARAPN